MALAIIGGMPERFAPFVESVARRRTRPGTIRRRFRSASTRHGYIAESSQQAADEFFPVYETHMTRSVASAAGRRPTRAQFDALCGPRGALLVGAPQTVAEKILFQYDIFGHQRYPHLLELRRMPHRTTMRSIELFGTEVAPLVRAGIAERARDANLEALARSSPN